MENINIIFSGCSQILKYHMNLFGYSVSLFNVLAFVFVGGILFKIIKSFF